MYRRAKKIIGRQHEIRRIEALAIPPAWTDVEISSSSSAKVLARGVDAAGRQQSIYHPAFRRRQERAKFERMVRFASGLPRLRAQVDRDMRRRALSRDRVTACVIRLLDEQLFRVGNSEYTRQHGSFGLTTLRKRHVVVSGVSIAFDFIGKSGKRQRRALRSERIAHALETLMQLPGPELFRFLDEDGAVHDLRSYDVNAYVHRHLGAEFSAKDFRTWGATLAATTALLDCDPEVLGSKPQAAAAARTVVSEVAELLGNTPAVARSSYIDPRVLTAFENASFVARLRRTRSQLRPRRFQSRDEQCALALLNSRAAQFGR